jgi:CheY-like chemotaxis protein
MITAYGNPATKNRASELGAISYIEKPFELKELLKKVRDVLAFDNGFVGNVAQLDLTDIIQMICLGKKTLTIEIANGSVKGYIYVIEGEIADAILGNKRGKDAFFEILSWDRGNFKFLPPVSDVNNTIKMRWENLLMEGMKYIDEKKNEEVKNSSSGYDIKKFEYLIDEVKGKIDDIRAIGFFNLDTKELITGESIEDDKNSLNKVKEYAIILKNSVTGVSKLEGEKVNEIIFTFDDRVIYFVFLDNDIVWGISVDNLGLLGKLKIVVNKVLKTN